MKRLFIAIFVLLAAVASSPLTPQQQYVQKYAAIAVSEMYRSGVPASITLAQGLLESNSGRSSLATKGNNHFGIKCHDWKGKSMRVDDDAPKECFRVYDAAEESFRDHSDFLRYRDRYKFLFDLKSTDYKGWAHGLRKAGYATDPAYATKLIKLIEDYDLTSYDKMSVKDAEKISGIPAPAVSDGASQTSSSDKVSSSKKSAKSSKASKSSKSSRKERRRSKGKAAPEPVYIDDSRTELPPSPLSIEEPKRVEKSGETFRFPLTREMYSRNGVPFIYSSPGETVESIASSYNLFPKEVLRFNDMSSASELLPGTIVYLQQKKTQAAKGLDKYIIDEDGQDLREIAQRFGVRLSSIYKMNGIDKNYVPREGDTIVLREGTLPGKMLRKVTRK